MNKPTPRAEAAAIARGLRRVLEREGATSVGEVLVTSARAVKRKEAAAAPAPTAPAPARSAPTVSSLTVSSGTGPAPTAPAESAATKAPSAPEVDLFGRPVPPAVARPVTLPEAFGYELPPVHAPLHPIGAPRRAILTASLPVLDEIAGQARACKRCGLCETRTNAVPGVGSAASGIVFVGEAPGADEDRLGEPFVGRAGELLTKIIKAMDDAQLIPGVPLSRETVYICNVLKCRPPENRNPLPHEVEQCSPYLKRQLTALQPRIICCLGKFAAELLVGVKGTIGGLRGKIYRYQGAKLIVTYHPAACLRNPGYKRPVWEDMQLLARTYPLES